MPSLGSKVKSLLSHLGRSRLIRLNEGVFFPFHRDSVGLGCAHTFRLISLLGGCGAGQFCFIYDNQRLNLEEGWLYFLNTKVEHALFSFGEKAAFMVLNVVLTEDSVNLVTQNLRAR